MYLSHSLFFSIKEYEPVHDLNKDQVLSSLKRMNEIILNNEIQDQNLSKDGYVSLKLATVSEINQHIIDSSSQGQISLSRLRSSFNANITYSGSSLDGTLSRNPGSGPRYVYTTQKGWIDMRHFFANAQSSAIFGQKVTNLAGRFIEFSQQRTDPKSAYSYEDYSSNKAGIDFWKQYGDGLLQGTVTVTEATSAYFDSIGAVAPEQAPNFDTISHFSWGAGPGPMTSKEALIGKELLDRANNHFNSRPNEEPHRHQDKIKKAHASVSR